MKYFTQITQMNIFQFETSWFLKRELWYKTILKKTLENAFHNVKYYSNTINHKKINPSSFTELRDWEYLPILTKKNITENYEDFLNTEEMPEYIHCTSGTTEKRLVIYGNRKETLALSNLNGLRLSEEKGDTSLINLRILPNSKRIYGPTSNERGNVYNFGVSFSLSDTHHNWFDHTDHLIEVLFNKYFFGGKKQTISSIHTTPPWVIDFFTTQILSRGICPADFGIKIFVASGGFTTNKIRRQINDLWKSEIYSSFSCTEINGESLEVVSMPGVYFPSPNVYAEIVDPDTYEKINYGETGILLLTSLFPFQSVMPFLRYATGDLVQKLPIPNASDSNLFLFRPIGRVNDCIKIGLRNYVGTIDILNTLSSFEFIPQLPFPRYTISLENNEILLTVESMPLFSMETDNEDKISQNLKTSLIERGINEISIPSIRCKLVGKNDIKNYISLYPNR